VHPVSKLGLAALWHTRKSWVGGGGRESAHCAFSISEMYIKLWELESTDYMTNGYQDAGGSKFADKWAATPRLKTISRIKQENGWVTSSRELAALRAVCRAIQWGSSTSKVTYSRYWWKKCIMR